MANRGRPRLADYVKADRQRLKAEQKAASARAKAERKELLKSLESELHDLARSYAGPTRSSYTEKGRRWKESVCYGLGQDYKDIGRSFRVTIDKPKVFQWLKARMPDQEREPLDLLLVQLVSMGHRGYKRVYDEFQRQSSVLNATPPRHLKDAGISLFTHSAATSSVGDSSLSSIRTPSSSSSSLRSRSTAAHLSSSSFSSGTDLTEPQSSPTNRLTKRKMSVRLAEVIDLTLDEDDGEEEERIFKRSKRL